MICYICTSMIFIFNFCIGGNRVGCLRGRKTSFNYGVSPTWSFEFKKKKYFYKNFSSSFPDVGQSVHNAAFSFFYIIDLE